MEIRILSDITETAEAAAEDAAGFIRENPGVLICFAAGDTTLPVFKALIQMQKENKLDLSTVYYAGLDEWVGLDRETKGSCAQVMFDEFFDPARIPEKRICMWNGMCDDIDIERHRLENWISSHGGIAMTMLGIGMNGHIGFNEPFTGLSEGTVYVPLDATTKKVSVKYFNEARSVAYGISIGAGELKKARKVILIATGPGKAEIVKKTVINGQDEAVPASLMTDHPDITLFLDKASAVLL